MRTRDYDICFVGLKCVDLLTGREPARYLGGIERDLVSIGTELAKLGYKVAFITYSFGSSNFSTDAGIDVIPSFKPGGGLRGMRLFYPQLFNVMKAIASTILEYTFRWVRAPRQE